MSFNPDEMLNFSVGPVRSNEAVLAISGRNAPYFRNASFSEVMLENERLMIELMDAPDGSRACFVTGSGTAGMEAAVMSLCSADDRALVVDGGSFGRRFCEMLELHCIPHDAIVLEQGAPLTEEDLAPYEAGGYTAFFVNVCETSTGVLYDKRLIGDFCARNELFLVVDVISTFLADEFSMAQMGASVAIAGSQKALGCHPGVSIVTLAPDALERAHAVEAGCMYLDLDRMLLDGERGQTPFTPAVSVLLQINERLRQVAKCGVAREVEKVASLAKQFRDGCSDLPLELRLESPSNAVTYVSTGSSSALDIVHALEDEYGIWVCPNGGPLADSSFRVGHIGDLTASDVNRLLEALRDLRGRGFMGSRREGTL